MRAISCLLALLLPPAGLFLWFGMSVVAWMISALWLAGILIFWLLWAGPGLALCLLAALCAVVTILLRRPSSSGKKAY